MKEHRCPDCNALLNVEECNQMIHNSKIVAFLEKERIIGLIHEYRLREYPDRLDNRREAMFLLVEYLEDA